MKKKLFLKFFVFAVIGSLLTFTSCKDYDDDIKNLQGQISSLKDLSDKLDGLTADVATAKTEAAAAKAAADEAIKEANALLDKVNAADSKATEAEKAAAEAKKEAAEAKKAAAEAKEEALKALETELEKAKEELKAATDAELEKMNKIVAELAEKVEAQLGTIGVAITEVYFIENEAPHVNFSTVVEKTNVFGKGLAGAITFTKDAQVQVGGHFFIKVSPANAVVTPEMIVLQNGLGEIYEDVTVTKVEAHTNLYTRATAPTGMWKVSVELENYDAKAFEAATTTKVADEVKNILFAVSINNTQAEFEDRQVISDYELSLGWVKYTAEKDLFFTVNKKKVEEIRNRFGRGLNGVVENKWKTDAATVATNDNVALDTDDNRSTFNRYPAVQGKDIVIELSEDAKALYVVLDKDYADESAPSEINAWNSYDYTGLNTVVVGNKATITIDSKTAIKDEIGFRVFAVNHDGTLQDPDGKAFYVMLDTKGDDWNSINTVIVPESEVVSGVKSGEVAVTLTKAAGATEATWLNAAGVAPNFDLYLVAGNQTVSTNAAFPAGFDFSKVTKVYTTAQGTDWKVYEDDKAYEGKLTLLNATGHVVATLDVTMTKKLPTTVPTGFSVKTNQVVGGIYNAYLVPNIWNAPDATEGTMPMKDVFNYGTGAAENYLITFATSKKDAENKDIDNAVAGDDVLSVAKSYIDNTTKHATSVEYNYGLISSKKDKDGNAIPHKVEAIAFETVYNNIYNSTYTWAWDVTLPVANRQKTDVVYGDNTFTVDLNKVAGKSGRDSKYNAPLGTPYLESLTFEKAELISKANNVSGEYFIVGGDLSGLTFTEASGSTNPTADVPSTLRITLKNMYNQDVVVNLDMIVKKR